MQPLHSKRWKKFCEYWENYWPKLNISVYGLADRSNNFSGSLNNITNSLNGKRPHIWQLISNLKLVDMHKSDELKNNIAGEMITTKRSQEKIRLNEKINKATELFNKSQNVDMFLKNVTFNTRLESCFKERIFIAGLDEDDFIDDSDDEDIIPNWFNVELNFRPPL